MILVVLFVTATTIAVIANDPIGSTFDFTIYTQIENGVPVGETAIPNKLYGSTVTFDAGTVNTNYDFVMYTVNGKIEFGLPESNTFIVYYELYVNVIYRDQSNFMVAFIDANQDLLEMKFVPSDGFSDAESSTMEPFNPIPGYVISDIEPWTGGSLLDVTEDRVLWVNYVPDSTSPLVTENLYLTVTDGTADLTEYSFNQVATVNADDIPLSNFQYWEKDGMIVSYNQEYSFTMLENTAITAVFAQTPSPNADILFINLIS